MGRPIPRFAKDIPTSDQQCREVAESQHGENLLAGSRASGIVPNPPLMSDDRLLKTGDSTPDSLALSGAFIHSFPRRGTYRHGESLPCSDRSIPGAGRLRNVPGKERAATSQLGRISG